ncbi:MAG: ABC transporter substrate-binding protein, partial [Dongiaceae bacterium]
ADFAKVGVETTVVTPELLGDFLRQSSDKDRDGAVLIGWTSDNGDPDNFLALLLSCDAVGISNRAQWCNAGFNELIEQAKTTADPAARAQLYAEAQKMIAEHQPLTAIAHTVVSVPMASTIAGYAASPLGHHNFEGVDIAE